MSAPKPRPGILEIAPYVGGKSSVAGVSEAIKLASNESATGTSPRAVEAYHGVGASLHRYPDGGSVALREGLAAFHGLPKEQILCGNGSDELLELLALAYAGPGDEVLYSTHGFLMYPIAARSVGATPVVAPEAGLIAEVDALLGCASARTRLVFLANPNNPTGTYLPATELARLRAGLPEEALLVIDSAYAEYVEAPDYSAGVELVDGGENVVVTRTFSKIYGLAALRLGWAYCPLAVASVLHRIRGPFNVTAPAQAAGLAALQDVDFLEAARRENTHWRGWLTDALTAIGLTVPPSVCNFVVIEFPDEPERRAADADAFLQSRGIILRDIASYGLPNCLRATIGCEDEMRALVDALTAFMDPGHGGAGDV